MNWTSYLKYWAGFSKSQVERDCLDMYESWTDYNDWRQIKNDFYYDQLKKNKVNKIFKKYDDETVREYLTDIISKIDLLENFKDYELLVLNKENSFNDCIINDNIKFGSYHPNFFSQTRESDDKIAKFCQKNYTYPYMYSMVLYFKTERFNHIQWEEICKKIAVQVKELLGKDLNVQVRVGEYCNKKFTRTYFTNLKAKERCYSFSVSIYDGPMNRDNPHRGLSIWGRPRRKKLYHYCTYEKTY